MVPVPFDIRGVGKRVKIPADIFQETPLKRKEQDIKS